MSYNDWDDWSYFPTSNKPKKANNGIKAIHQKGEFCKEWWGKQWIEIIESYNLGERLSRGRRYARSGQVLEIQFNPGNIRARVQGSRFTPYSVHLNLNIWSKSDWKEVIKYIKSKPLLLSQIISGKLPTNLDKDLLQLGVDLFPHKYKDFSTDCTCPDYSNPCKHIAAVFYIISESLDRNPFILFEIRGKDRDKLIKSLISIKTKNKEMENEQKEVTEPLSVEHFWDGNMNDAVPSYFIKPIVNPASNIHQMGSFPMWQVEIDFFKFWDDYYDKCTKKAIQQLEKSIISID